MTTESIAEEGDLHQSLGQERAFDSGMTRSATEYADQTERDHARPADGVT